MTTEEKLDYVKYLYNNLYEMGEPIGGTKLTHLRDIIYTGKYGEWEKSSYDFLIKKYFIDNGYNIENIVEYIRNKKLDSIFS